MPESAISFINADAASPEGKIFATINTALQYISFTDFIGSVVTAVAGSESLTDTQKMGVKYAAKSFVQSGNPTNIDEILLYVLYGTYQDIGLAEAADEPLTAELREGLLYTIYAVAKGVIEARIAELETLTGWTYSIPDWEIEE